MVFRTNKDMYGKPLGDFECALSNFGLDMRGILQTGSVKSYAQICLQTL